MFELVKMWALVEALGLLSLPLTIIVFRHLPDRGWSLSKALGMTVFAFAVWFPLVCVPTLPYSQPFVWGVGLLFLVGSLVGFWRTHRTLRTLVRSQWAYLLLSELVFVGMVALLGFLRQFHPDLRSSENFMDEGIVAALMRSPHLPPNDVWFSGFSINYYYYAHFLAATLGKIIGQAPSVVLNTVLCIFFGLTAVNLFGVTCNIVAWTTRARLSHTTIPQPSLSSSHPLLRPRSLLLRAAPFGLSSVAMGLLFGNLASANQWRIDTQQSVPYEWFYPAHVIPNTLNEFPAYSFLLADFHAQIITLAFTVLALGVAFNLFLGEERGGLRLFGRGWRLPCTLVISALSIGQLFVMGGWEYPTFLAVALLAVILQQWLAYGSRLTLRWLRDAFSAVLVLGGLSWLLFAPFYLTYSAPTQGLGLVAAQNRSTLVDEVGIYGLFAFVFISFLLVCFWYPRPLLFRRTMSRHHISAPPLSSLPRVSGDLVQDKASSSPAHASALQPSAPQTMSDKQSPRPPSMVLEQEPASSLSEESRPLVSGQEQETRASVHPRRTGMGWRDRRLLGLYAFLVAGLLVLFLLKNSIVFVLAGGLATLASMLTLFFLKERSRAFVLLLGTVAFALVAVCEVVYVNDGLLDPFVRFNTVFKFYYQAWILFSVACGCGLFFLHEAFWSQERKGSSQPESVLRWGRRGLAVVWALGLLVLILASSVYPVVAPAARLSTYNAQTGEMSMRPTWSLDGMTFLQQCQPPDRYPDMDSDPFAICQYDVTAEYAALRWINAHIPGDPTIVEASIHSSDASYSLYGRVSSFTGLPTIVGWSGHEGLWRNAWLNNPANEASYLQRFRDIATIYTDPNPQVVMRTMRQYHAEYLFVGALERVTYPKGDLTRFASFLRTVYDAGGVAIYQLPQ